MTLGRLLMHVGWTLAFPGAGQGAAGRKVAAIGWAAAGLVLALAITWTIWAAYAALVLRVASAAELALRRPIERDKNLPLYASLVGVAGFVYFMFATERYAIPTPSMMPAIAPGDSVYIEKVTKLVSSPARGEVIVFMHPCEARAHIKRVVGVARDTIELRCGTLYVNGRASTPAYATLPDVEGRDFPALDRLVRACPKQTNQPAGVLVETKAGAAACDPQLHFVVPDASLFVLGDNRASSNDSRNWGVVPLANVTGRAIGIVWPLAHAGAVH